MFFFLLLFQYSFHENHLYLRIRTQSLYRPIIWKFYFLLSIISYPTRARGIIVNYIGRMTIRRIKGVEYSGFTLISGPVGLTLWL